MDTGIERSLAPMNSFDHKPPSALEFLPDVRDGLTRRERVVLYCLHELQRERKGRNVPTVMLYGRVVEHVNMSEQELQTILQRLTGFKKPGSETRIF